MADTPTLPPRLARGWTLVDFHASWCGPCRMLAPVIEELSRRYRGELTVAKVDVDRAPDTARAYRVSSMPTLVLCRDGREVARTTGFRPLEDLARWIESERAAA